MSNQRGELSEITNIFLEHGTIFLSNTFSNNPKTPKQIKGQKVQEKKLRYDFSFSD